MEEKASFSYWREGAGKPPQKLKMRVPAWERKASFSHSYMIYNPLYRAVGQGGVLGGANWAIRVSKF
jgi:hypothetical protein